MRLIGKLILPLVLIVALAGCATTGTTATTHPGAINSFDSAAYDALVTAQAAIEQAKTQVFQNPQLRDPLNKVIASYNAAQLAYKIYHSAGGGDTAALQQQIDSLKVAVAALAQVATK